MPHPLLPAKYLKGPIFQPDLGPKNPALTAELLASTTAFNKWLWAQINTQGASMAAGGYLEQRVIYQRSPRYQKDSDLLARSIHLGIDFWLPGGTEVYLPYDGEIHSYADNQQGLDYGPTLITTHKAQGETFHLLLGHLSRGDMTSWKKGLRLEAGTQVATVGHAQENGGWAPHVHVQIIRDLEGYEGDFPGVCRADQLDHFSQICPNPLAYLGLKLE